MHECWKMNNKICHILRDFQLKTQSIVINQICESQLRLIIDGADKKCVE